MIKPLKNRILCEVVKNDGLTTTKGGILIADQRIPQCIELIVKAIGPEVTVAKEDDHIFVPQFSPTEIRQNYDDNFVIIPEEDVVAVVVPD